MKLTGWNGRMLQNGYAANLEGFLGLLKARVFSVGDSLDSEAAKVFRERLRQWGIPYGMPSNNTLQVS